MRRKGKQGIILRKNWQSMVSKTTAERKCHICLHHSKPSCFKGLITTMEVEFYITRDRSVASTFFFEKSGVC